MESHFAHRFSRHAYHSQRILTVSSVLRSCGEVAGLHHERIDGSGYHRGLPATALPLGARLLGAAEAYQSMTEDQRRTLVMPWDHRTGKLNVYAIVQAAPEAVKREVYGFLKEYFGE